MISKNERKKLREVKEDLGKPFRIIERVKKPSYDIGSKYSKGILYLYNPYIAVSINSKQIMGFTLTHNYIKIYTEFKIYTVTKFNEVFQEDNLEYYESIPIF